MQKEHHLLSQRESNLLSAIALVRRIAAFKLHGVYRDAAEDIVQKVSLNLWRWNVRKKERAVEEAAIDFPSVTNEAEETDAENQGQWLRLANIAARNEITSFFRSKYRREKALAESSLEDAAHETHAQRRASNRPSNPEGNSPTEIASLLRQVWKIAQEFSFRQKYSFLLQKEELIINLLSHGCCRRQEMADSFGLDKAEFDTIVINLPLSDEAICDLIEKKTGERLTLRQIWMARGKAKAKLAGGLKHLL